MVWHDRPRIIGGAYWSAPANPRPLAFVFAVFLVISTGGVAIKFLWDWTVIWYHEQEAFEMEAIIQRVEEEIAAEPPAKTSQGANGQWIYEYTLPSKNIRVLDEYQDGMLAFREFYQGANRIARDQIRLESGLPQGKEREYYQNGCILIMTEKFTKAGVSIEKSYCRNGSRSNCFSYVRNDRSPLPVVVLRGAYRNDRPPLPAVLLPGAYR